MPGHYIDHGRRAMSIENIWKQHLTEKIHPASKALDKRIEYNFVVRMFNGNQTLLNIIHHSNSFNYNSVAKRV